MDIVAQLVEARSQVRSEIARRVLEFIAAHTSRGIDLFSMFVFCLCQESDVANQWFTYADQGRGFELGFDLGPLNGLSTRTSRNENS
jgi:hypothetical protein